MKTAVSRNPNTGTKYALSNTAATHAPAKSSA